MFCFADATGEALSGLLRPGNAGSNTVAEHVSVLEGALAQLPEAVRAGECRAGKAVNLIVRRLREKCCTERRDVRLESQLAKRPNSAQPELRERCSRPCCGNASFEHNL